MLCSKCKNDLPVDHFTRRSDRPRGYRSECKACRCNVSSESVMEGVKTCCRCKIEKDVNEFATCRRSIDGREWACRVCENKRKNTIGKIGTQRIVRNLRRRVLLALRGVNKSESTLELLGCTPSELKSHLETQFTEGMSWDNYGLYGWHIDHIKPCCSFDLTDSRQQKECFNYTNLQPLWAKDNLRKGRS